MTLKEKWNKKPGVPSREGYVAFPVVCSRFKAEIIGTLGVPIAAIFFLLSTLRIPLSLIKQDLIALFNMAMGMGEVFIKTQIRFQQNAGRAVTHASFAGLFVASAAAVLLIFFAIMYIQLAIHEWLHAFGWTVGTGMKVKDCDIMINKACCHCSEDMTVKRSLLGTMLPAIILGFLPIIISTIIVSPILLLLGTLGIIEAGMDLVHGIQTIRFLKYKGAISADDPEFIGGIIYVPENQLREEEKHG